MINILNISYCKYYIYQYLLILEVTNKNKKNV